MRFPIPGNVQAEFTSEGLGESDDSDLNNQGIETEESLDDDRIEEVEQTLLPGMRALEWFFC